MKPLVVILCISRVKVVTFGNVRASRNPLPGYSSHAFSHVLDSQVRGMERYCGSSASYAKLCRNNFLDEILSALQLVCHLLGGKLKPVAVSQACKAKKPN